MFDLKILIILALGMFLGGLVFSPTFRKKFFIGFRKFIAQLGEGARSYSQRTQGRPTGRRDISAPPSHKRRIIDCPGCEGTGLVPRSMPKMLDKRLWGEKMDECPTCKGSGRVYDN